MRKSLRSLSLIFGSLLFSGILNAQDKFAYAVTDMQQHSSNWSFLRKLDLRSGKYSDILLNGTDQNITAFDASSRKELAPVMDARYGQLANAAFGTGVAAIAFDKKNNRLYYTPMFIDQLRYIDLKTMKVYYLSGENFTGKPVKSSDQGNIVTRMVIGSDGNGYAMTNDAMQLIRFTTGKKAAIIDLGPIADGQDNKNVSIHSSCSSYGGDMIADDNGSLYVFSARNNVFKINIETKVATYLGNITGLPANFTVNGAAVISDNKVLVGSATLMGSYFTVDMKNLSASAYAVEGGALQSSDLANSNLLVSGNRPKATDMELMKNKPVDLDETRINVYPNPVTDNKFVVQFGQLEPGTYTVQVTDVTGRQVLQQVVTISGVNQSQLIKLDRSASKSVYLVKVLNASNKSVFSSKLIVQ